MVIRAPGDVGWIARSEQDVRAVLCDDRFSVPEVGPAAEVGTIVWLRASVSRFVNGPAHEQRRARAVAELARVEPARLRATTHAVARAELDALAPSTRIDVMASLARRSPAVALAALLGAADPPVVAEAVIDCALGYFPGSEIEAERRADAATARLVRLLADPDLDVTIARIALLVQGCDATAGLIGSALANGLSLDAALREQPPIRTMRRVAHAGVRLGAALIRPGDPVLCDIDAASDPATLTFGDGRRPCPAPDHAKAAAAGVVDAVRTTCALIAAGPVETLPIAALRIPRHVWVTRA
jgi:hypothetical protein